MSLSVALQCNERFLDFFCYILRYIVHGSDRPLGVDIRRVQEWEKVSVIKDVNLGFDHLEEIGIKCIAVDILGPFDLVCAYETNVELSIDDSLNNSRLVPREYDLLWICKSTKM